MKNLSLRAYLEITVVSVAVIVVGFLLIQQHQDKKTQQDLRNQLSEAQGTIEIGSGVYYRLAQELVFKENQISNLLGENTRL